MTVKIKYVEEIEDFLRSDLLPPFSICSGNSPTFSFLRLQCRGDIDADAIKGPQVRGERHIQLCLESIRIAKDMNVDIFMTPEYAFPIEIVNKILEDKGYQPSRGKLWCLSCQGVPVNDFEDSLTRWEQQGAYVVWDSFLKADLRRFIGAVIYIFRLTDGRICILPQIKTKAMADPNLACEEAGMSLGTQIYMFGKGQANRLCSIICADALNRAELTMRELFPNGSEPTILLHPQLNTKPRNDNFAEFRRDLFMNNESQRLIYITANWADNTTLSTPISTQPGVIQNPWSCVYFKKNNFDLTDELKREIQQNHNAGIGFAYWKLRAHIWYSTSKEVLQFLYIKKPNQIGPLVTNPRPDLVASWTWIPENNEYQLTYNREDPALQFNHFEDDLNSHIDLGEEYNYPLTETSILKLDRFFGLSLGHFEDGQWFADENEICGRIGLYIDQECDSSRQENMDEYRKLVSALKKGHLPQHIKGKSMIQELTLSNDQKYNLLLKDDQSTDEALVAFVSNYRKAEGIVEALHRITGVNKDKICVFSQNTLLETEYFPKPNNEITNPHQYNKHEITDVNGGMSSAGS